jgi:predicted ATPase
MMDEQVRVSNHLTFGRCLVEPSLESGDDDMLFVGVNHINLAGRGAISDARDFAIMAQFNLTAGKRAVEMSDFSSASSFFSHGIQFLPDSHWTQEYTLSRARIEDFARYWKLFQPSDVFRGSYTVRPHIRGQAQSLLHHYAIVDLRIENH